MSFPNRSWSSGPSYSSGYGYDHRQYDDRHFEELEGWQGDLDLEEASRPRQMFAEEEAFEEEQQGRIKNAREKFAEGFHFLYEDARDVDRLEIIDYLEDVRMDFESDLACFEDDALCDFVHGLCLDGGCFDDIVEEYLVVVEEVRADLEMHSCSARVEEWREGRRSRGNNLNAGYPNPRPAAFEAGRLQVPPNLAHPERATRNVALQTTRAQNIGRPTQGTPNAERTAQAATNGLVSSNTTGTEVRSRQEAPRGGSSRYTIRSDSVQLGAQDPEQRRTPPQASAANRGWQPPAQAGTATGAPRVQRAEETGRGLNYRSQHQPPAVQEDTQAGASDSEGRSGSLRARVEARRAQLQQTREQGSVGESRDRRNHE